MSRHTLRFDELKIEGSSRAGDETWIRVHPPGLAFDAGRGAGALAGARDLFLTHGHLDHALGVPFVLSHRGMQDGSPTRVFCPRPVAEPLGRFVDAAAALEREEYRYEIRPLEPGDRVEVGKRLLVEAFATDHVVPSLGYHLVRVRERLVEGLQGLPPEEIARRRAAGETVTAQEEELWVSYCGDSTGRVFDLEPRLGDSRVLILECTFLEPEMRERAERHGHLHFEELEARRHELRNEAIVLHHLSRRYRLEELRERIDRRLPELAPRIHLLGEESAGGPGPRSTT